jgi:hypothetical protein
MAHPAAPVAKPTAPETPSTPPSPPAELDLAVELVDATSSWLSGLELVRERFAALLAIEGIQSLQALGQPFDPRLHLAIEAEERSDAPPNTVVRVLRQGYRQRQRVLRYAEVVVSRLPVKVEAMNSAEQDLEPDLGQDLEPPGRLGQDLEPDLIRKSKTWTLEQDGTRSLEDQEPTWQDPESDMESKVWNRAWNPKVEKNDEQF